MKLAFISTLCTNTVLFLYILYSSVFNELVLIMPVNCTFDKRVWRQMFKLNLGQVLFQLLTQ